MARLALGVTEMDLMDKRRQNTKKSITSLADGSSPGGVYWIWWRNMYGTLCQAKKRDTCAPYFSGSLGLPPTIGHAHVGNTTTTGSTAILTTRLIRLRFGRISTCLRASAIISLKPHHIQHQVMPKTRLGWMAIKTMPRCSWRKVYVVGSPYVPEEMPMAMMGDHISRMVKGIYLGDLGKGDQTPCRAHPYSLSACMFVATFPNCVSLLLKGRRAYRLDVVPDRIQHKRREIRRPGVSPDSWCAIALAPRGHRCCVKRGDLFPIWSRSGQHWSPSHPRKVPCPHVSQSPLDEPPSLHEGKTKPRGKQEEKYRTGKKKGKETEKETG